MKAAPKDKPFVCKKGHVTEVGWSYPCFPRIRCRECHRIRRIRSQRKYRSTHHEKCKQATRDAYHKNKEYYKRARGNYIRGIGRERIKEWNAKYRAKNRVLLNQKQRERNHKMFADGLASNLSGWHIGIPPSLLAKLNAGGD